MASLARGFSLVSCRLPAAAARTAGPARFFFASSGGALLRKTRQEARLFELVEFAGQRLPSRSLSSAASPSRYAFIKSLATKPSPTTLYEAPSHFWFYFGCWSSGLALVSWTALTGPTVVDQPEGVPQWVSIVFGVSYVLLGAMGFYVISKTPNIVGAIRVLPSVSAAPVTAAAAAAPHPRLEVTVKRMVPFLRPKTIVTDLDSVSLKTRFSLPGEYVPELRRREEERRKTLHKFDMQHLLTMPFRRLGRALVDMFRGVRAAWTDMGFGAIKVDGKYYKVDVTKGFAHDGFRTLEQIVHIETK